MAASDRSTLMVGTGPVGSVTSMSVPAVTPVTSPLVAATQEVVPSPSDWRTLVDEPLVVGSEKVSDPEFIVRVPVIA